VVIGLGEDLERAARELRARTEAPLVTGLSVAGSALVACAPVRLPDLFAGSPALVAVELAPRGGTLAVRGQTAGGVYERQLEVAPAPAGAEGGVAAALFGRESVEDLETRLAAGEEREPLDRAVERLGLAFQISTRLTSWVAVSEEATVDPTRPTRRVRVAQELPYGMSAEGLGLRSVSRPGAVRTTDTVHVLFQEAALGPARVRPARSGGRARKQAAPRPAAVDRGERIASGPSRMPEEEAAPVKHPLRLTATARKVGGSTVLEAEVGEPGLAWDPPATVRVRLRDGRELEVEVDAATTGAAALAPGQILRLVFRAPALDPEEIAEVGIDLDGGDLVLSVKC